MSSTKTAPAPTAAVPIDLMNLVQLSGDHLWLGQHAPFSWETLDLTLSTNCRAAPSLHQQFDVVWWYEEQFNGSNSTRMELILDEMIRLIKEDGLLVVRYETAFIPWLKKFMARRLFAEVDVEQEFRRDNEMVTAFRVRRTHRELYRDSRWTFAILTTGSKEKAVVDFLRSVREHPDGAPHEILICGPRSPSYEPYDVNYLDSTYRNDVAEIGKKKNDIAAAARHPNLLIAHDRYVLSPDFFEGFERFGYDFDFLTIRQWLDTGEEFPSYCTMEHAGPPMNPVRMLRRYDAIYPGHFVNGGIFAVKTHALKAVRLNPLLYWEQAEDVEFTQTMRQHGLPPRMNCFASATTSLSGPRGPIYRNAYHMDDAPLPDEMPLPPLSPGRRILIAKKFKRVVDWCRSNKKMVAAWGSIVAINLAILLLQLINLVCYFVG